MLVGWAILGVVLGAAGSEWLHAQKPELIGKIEKAASRFVDLLCSSKSCEKENKENMDI